MDAVGSAESLAGTGTQTGKLTPATTLRVRSGAGPVPRARGGARILQSGARHSGSSCTFRSGTLFRCASVRYAGLQQA